MCAMPLYNPNKKYDTATVYDALKSGFSGIHDIVRDDAAARWKTLSAAQKCDAGRGLLFVADIAKNPAKYFSREQTTFSWDTLPDGTVSSPSTIVYNGLCQYDIASGKTLRIFYELAEMAKNWEYDRTSRWPALLRNTDRFAYNIIRMSYDIGRRARITRAHPIVRPMLRFLQNIFQYE